MPIAPPPQRPPPQRPPPQRPPPQRPPLQRPPLQRPPLQRPPPQRPPPQRPPPQRLLQGPGRPRDRGRLRTLPTRAGGVVEESEQLERFKDFLTSKGLRLTKQRQAIAEVFFRSSAHLSLPELLALARREHPSVGYATVYRTMKILAESGLATEHKFAEGSVRYESSIKGEHHDHLICVDCGRIVEYEDDEIERLQEELAR
ncbi:MAG TPA: transcriptional repressor, partial [Deltaproteobacteria bacterium]|nr:transcriptional repressor [Deltaproteobacteria bacterium]